MGLDSCQKDIIYKRTLTRGVGPTPAVCESVGPRFVNGVEIAGEPFILREPTDDPSSTEISLVNVIPLAAAAAAN